MAKKKQVRPSKATRSRRKRTRPGDSGTESPPLPEPRPMAAPPSGVTVRMYRQGHGDCFLMAFRQADGKPYYVLIDCGMKKGSRITPNPQLNQNTPFGCSMEDVVKNIVAATRGRLHLV